jgi:hypothetical protein
MGLLYVFPVSKDETDFVAEKDGALILKTYGLPYIFWAYALCVIAVIFFMFLAVKEPVLKLVLLGDETDASLGYALLIFIGLLPVSILGFFFYEKRITRRENELGVVHRVFGVTVFSETFTLGPADALVVEPFLASPNVARMNAKPENLGFQNKGYFVLSLAGADGEKITLDRHSRKADLDKLKALIEDYSKV